VTEYKHKLLDLKTDDQHLIGNVIENLIEHSRRKIQNDEYEETISNIGRIIVGLANVSRLNIGILPVQSEQLEFKNNLN